MCVKAADNCILNKGAASAPPFYAIDSVRRIYYYEDSQIFGKNNIIFGGNFMSSAGTSSSLFIARWNVDYGWYRIFEADYPNTTVALLYQWLTDPDSPWIFEPVICSDDFRPPLSFDDGPLIGQHSYPLDITVLTDTDDFPF